jgi:AcrR family transcriptional regulator
MENGAAATRERIFDAGVRLFARRGYEAVGIRDIAKEAEANIAGVNYHYGGKLGLLEAILTSYTERYWSALKAVAERRLPVREHVRETVEALVRFYRENTELAVASENSGNMRISEVNSLVARLQAANRDNNNRYFVILGLDLGDPAVMTLMRGLLTHIIASHFHGRFEQEVVTGPPQGLTAEEQAKLPELTTKYDDAFYERFAAKFTDFYLAGVQAIRAGQPAAKLRRKAKPARAVDNEKMTKGGKR